MSEAKNPVIVPSFVGLDLSLTGTGFCVKRGAELQMVTIKTTPKTAANDLARLQYIRDTLMEMIPDSTMMICVEDFFVPHNPMQMNSAKGLIMVGTVTRIAMLERGLPFLVVADTQLKKYATGKGNGPKGIVIREIYKKWGINAADDNQADACVLAHMAEAIYCHLSPDVSMVSSVELHKYQVEMVEKVVAERPRYNLLA